MVHIYGIAANVSTASSTDSRVSVFMMALIALLVIWSLLWKGLGLWHTAQRRSMWWFIIFLLVNTAGILEIVYLFGIIKVGFRGLFKKDTYALEDEDIDVSMIEMDMEDDEKAEDDGDAVLPESEIGRLEDLSLAGGEDVYDDREDGEAAREETEERDEDMIA